MEFSQEVKRRQITDTLGWLGAAIMTIWAVAVIAVNHAWDIVTFDLASAAAFLLVVFLNRKGLYYPAKLLLIVFINAVVFLFAAFFGGRTGTHYCFLPLTALPFAIFDSRNRFTIVFGNLMPMGLFILLVATDFRIFRPYQLIPEKTWIFWLTVVTAFFLSSFSLFVFRRANEKSENALRASQSKLMMSAKMTALGEMAAGIAHEINNPLTALRIMIGSTKGYATTAPPQLDKIVSITDRMDATIDRIAKIIEGLRVFSRGDEATPIGEVSVSQVVEETMAFCRERFKVRGIELVVPAIRRDLKVMGRSVQVSQVLLNFLNNAFHATEAGHGKRVAVEIRDAGDAIEFSVIDNGTGIPAEIQEKIFQPFFTTKAPGVGTGLGLSVSKGIVESLGGRIWFGSKPGHTVFTFALPNGTRPY